ncbi:precorrin-2 dehydrogenase/sirohydrochlorin ferrochelatase family protein [Ferrimonas lipolytica]|uniref:precorrin-2 dehydrogenase n=1 Tax=Ferrimonas lipolytica TaxID=2724191 RepID=A0A6H1UD60_9GAMM|nr:bifunctional precorrin-2 dehydrogenase/sirohydrochlorin ferrochelatase [Ferrimonas lipolytica]QIZ77011.1 bifunctional precorrin-2 dehydrogenase/sirohydrochlorin ferrochelatase [Ferrimonas lipolytica]
MRYFPLFHDTEHMRLLVVGGGEVAARKVALWARSNAVITVVSLDWVDSITELAPARIECITTDYDPHHLEGRQGVIAATDNAELNRQIAREAKALGLWVNVVDQPELCTVITPAIVDRAPMLVAIGSEGKAPVLVRTLRALIETILPSSLGKLAQFIGSKRHKVQQQSDNPRVVWEHFLQQNGLVLNQDSEQHLQAAINKDLPSGKLWLMYNDQQPLMLPIGLMPELQRLDRVVYATELDAQLLELCRRDAAQSAVNTAELEQIQTWVRNGERVLLYLDRAAQTDWLSQINLLAGLSATDIADFSSKAE